MMEPTPIRTLIDTSSDTDLPDPAWVRGRCPRCGEPLVSHLYYIENKGYLIEWKCWASREDSPTCTYKVVL